MQPSAHKHIAIAYDDNTPVIDDDTLTPLQSSKLLSSRVGGPTIRRGMLGGASARVPGLRKLSDERGTVGSSAALGARRTSTGGGGTGGTGGTGGSASTYGSGKNAMNAWGLGNQHFLDVTGPGSGDRLVEGGFKVQRVGPCAGVQRQVAGQQLGGFAVLAGAKLWWGDVDLPGGG